MSSSSPSYGGSPASGPQDAVSGTGGKSFFASLFDFSLSSYVTLRFLRVIYLVVTIVIAVAYVVAVIGALTQGLGQFLGVLVVGAVLALLYLVIARVYVEVISVLFRINDNTARMAAALDGGAGPGGPGGTGPGWVPSGGTGPTSPPPVPAPPAPRSTPPPPPYPGATPGTPPPPTAGPLGPQSPWSSGGSTSAGPTGGTAAGPDDPVR